MKTDQIQRLTDTFEGHAQQTEGGVESWLARARQHTLGYTECRNFTVVVSKAQTACEVSGHVVSDHFVEVNKMVDLESGFEKSVPSCLLVGALASVFVARKRRRSSDREHDSFSLPPLWKRVGVGC